MIIPEHLRELRKILTAEQWVKVAKAELDAGKCLSKIYNKWQRSKKKYELE